MVVSIDMLDLRGWVAGMSPGEVPTSGVGEPEAREMSPC